MNKRIGIFLLALLAVSNSAHAVDELVRNYRGIRSLGMGGVVSTTGNYDEALFGNPARITEAETWKLSILGVTAEINSGLIDHASVISDATNASGAGVISTLADKGVVGDNLHYRLSLIAPGFYSPKFFGENTGFAFALLVNNQVNTLLNANAIVDVQALVDFGPSFGVSHRMLDGNLSVGMNARFIYRLAGDPSIRASDLLGGQKIGISDIAGQGIGVDTDIGAYYKLPFQVPFFKKISFGGQVNNLVKSSYRLTGTDIIAKAKSANRIHNDRVLGFGTRMDLPDFLIMTDSLVAIEMQNVGSTRRAASFWKKFHFGGETHFLGKLLAVRAGLNQGYLGGGVGIDLPIVKIDLATYGEELGATVGTMEDRRYAVRLAFEI